MLIVLAHQKSHRYVLESDQHIVATGVRKCAHCIAESRFAHCIDDTQVARYSGLTELQYPKDQWPHSTFGANSLLVLIPAIAAISRPLATLPSH
jgi:hypothetical protein